MSSNNQQTQQGNLHLRRTGVKKGQLVTGILLIISSSLTIIFGVVAVSLPTLYYAYGGNPLWTGAIILSTGILCTYSSKGTRRCHTISAFVMGIISIVFAIDQIFWMSVAAASENWENDRCRYNYYYYYNYDCGTEIAVDSVLIALGVFELGFAIAAVCVLSMDVCCGTRRQPTMPVFYQAGQPVVLQGGYVQSMAPVYPPQTHIVTQPGQVYLQQQVPQYPVVQVTCPVGQIQQYPPGGQPQQQCPPGGQPTQAVPPAEQQYQFHPPAYNN